MYQEGEKKQNKYRRIFSEGLSIGNAIEHSDQGSNENRVIFSSSVFEGKL